MQAPIHGPLPVQLAPAVMGDAPAQAAITAALLPDGAITAAIVAEIKKSFEQGNQGDLLISAAAGAAANTLAVPAVITAIKDEGSELSKLLTSARSSTSSGMGPRLRGVVTRSP